MRKYIRKLSLLLIMTLTTLSFQNCAPQQEVGSTTDTFTAGKSSQSSVSNSSTNSSGSKGGVIQIGSGTVSRGGSTGGSSGSKGNGVIQIGSGSGSGGTSYNGSGSQNAGGAAASGDKTLRIIAQPVNVNVYEGADFQLQVDFAGGVAPYSYQWFLNGQAIDLNSYASYYIFKSVADTYKKEGRYHIVIKDSTGNSVQSIAASVGIVEPQMGCEAGSYFTYTNSDFDKTIDYFDEYFAGPRGKFLLYQSFDTYGALYPNRSFAGLKDWIIPALQYKELVHLPCASTIPRIHTPEKRPKFRPDLTYTGAVVFECHNKKIKFIEDTCKWK